MDHISEPPTRQYDLTSGMPASILPHLYISYLLIAPMRPQPVDLDEDEGPRVG